mmetsp:Transcript_12072/g.36815  ORF Transcript_12072/g.36815 Transcript_12072/m.36815 type:complete len:397 (+) Transcript_12072:67-1257(+)
MPVWRRQGRLAVAVVAAALLCELCVCDVKLEEKVNQLEALVNDGATVNIKEHFDGKVNDIAGLRWQVQDIQDRIERVNKDRAEMRSKHDEKRREIETVENTLSELDKKITDIKRELEKPSSKVQELSVKVNSEREGLLKDRAELDSTVNKVQTLLQALDMEINAVKKLRDPALSHWLEKQAHEIGAQLKSPITAALLLTTVDSASLLYNSSASYFAQLDENIPIKRSPYPNFVRFTLLLLFASVLSLVAFKLYSTINVRRMITIISWCLFFACCQTFIIGIRDKSDDNPERTASPNLLGSQILMVVCGVVLMLTLSLALVQSVLRKERLILIAAMAGLGVYFFFYIRTSLYHTMYSIPLTDGFIVGNALGCLFSMTLAITLRVSMTKAAEEASKRS